MGLLVDGVWQRRQLRQGADAGRPLQRARPRNSATGSPPTAAPAPPAKAALPAEPGRYHLYVSLACPWAHRTIIFRKLKRLENVDLDVGRRRWHMGEHGWTFDTSRKARAATRVNGKQQACRKSICWPIRNTPAASPCRCCGTRSARPSSTTSRPRSSGCSTRRSTRFTNERTDYYPPPLRGEIDARQRPRLSEHQQRRLSRRLRHRRRTPTRKRSAACSRRSTSWSGGCRASAISPAPRITEADWRLFPTLIRFDAVYYSHFKCNLRRIGDYPEPVELSARSLSGAGHRRDREHRPHQAALLRQPAQGEPDRHRAARPGARLHRPARPRPVCEHAVTRPTCRPCSMPTTSQCEMYPA